MFQPPGGSRVWHFVFKTSGTREVRFLTIQCSATSGEDPPLRLSTPTVGWGRRLRGRIFGKAALRCPAVHRRFPLPLLRRHSTITGDDSWGRYATVVCCARLLCSSLWFPIMVIWQRCSNRMPGVDWRQLSFWCKREHLARLYHGTDLRPLVWRPTARSAILDDGAVHHSCLPGTAGCRTLDIATTTDRGQSANLGDVPYSSEGGT